MLTFRRTCCERVYVWKVNWPGSPNLIIYLKSLVLLVLELLYCLAMTVAIFKSFFLFFLRIYCRVHVQMKYKETLTQLTGNETFAHEIALKHRKCTLSKTYSVVLKQSLKQNQNSYWQTEDVISQPTTHVAVIFSHVQVPAHITTWFSVFQTSFFLSIFSFIA